MTTRRVAAALFVLSSIPTLAAAETYAIDGAHSKILFKVRHLGISSVTGQFKQFSGSIELDKNDLKSLTSQVVIESASVDTEQTDRDNHLRSGDFFDVQQHPQIRFESTGVERADGQTVHLRGNLTIRGVTKPVTLEAVFGGAAAFQGKERIAFTATGRVNRKDFGVSWNRTLDTGGLVVADDVDLVIEVEAVAESVSE